jgi:arylsulfatase I/J
MARRASWMPSLGAPGVARTGLSAALLAAAIAGCRSEPDTTCSGSSCTEVGLEDDVSLLAKLRHGSAPRGASGSSGSRGTQPHIVYLLIDDLGWSDTEFGGSGTADFGFVSTPTMKALQPESVKLNKMYGYSWCGPSRSALLSGRLPVHVNVNHSNPMAFIRSDPLSSGEGVPAGMTMIGTKLKEAGYSTHYTGKWGVGFTWKDQNPMSRGFDTFFGYLHDSVDYWNQKLGAESIEMPGGCEAAFKELHLPGLATDLIRNGEPARGENGTEWVDYLFLKESLGIIEEHNASTPLFLFHSFHSVHAPLNAPAELYVGNYSPPPCEGEDAMRTCFKKLGPLVGDDRRSYGAMVTFADSAMGKIVNALKDKGMWGNTLMVVSADNGGPQYMSEKGYQMWGSGNNLPLRGGKVSEFEGGIRLNSFVTGGLLPAKVRGMESDALMHLADWYGTFCFLAGVSQEDDVAVKNRLPDVDSINLWPTLSGEAGASARTGIQVSPVTLIEGSWKLLTGPDSGSINSNTAAGFVPFKSYAVGYHDGYPFTRAPVMGAVMASWGSACQMAQAELDALYALAHHGSNPTLLEDPLDPQVSTRLPALEALKEDCQGGMNCRSGCLFNLDADPNEKDDVAAQFPEIVSSMQATLANLSKLWTPEEPWGVFNPIRAGNDPRYNGPEKCRGLRCTDMRKCREFVYKTGFYSWAADAERDAAAEQAAAAAPM